LPEGEETSYGKEIAKGVLSLKGEAQKKTSGKDTTDLSPQDYKHDVAILDGYSIRRGSVEGIKGGNLNRKGWGFSPSERTFYGNNVRQEEALLGGKVVFFEGRQKGRQKEATTYEPSGKGKSWGINPGGGLAKLKGRGSGRLLE